MQTIDLRGKIGKSPLGDLGVQRPSFDSSSLEETVKNILVEVKADGDEAVRKFTLNSIKLISMSCVLVILKLTRLEDLYLQN